MKQIKIIGIGMGDEASLTVAARDWIVESDVLIGASRMVRAAVTVSVEDERRKSAVSAMDIGPKDFPVAAKKECVIAWQPKDIWNAIRQSGKEKFAVLMSGDLGFFSGARALREELARRTAEEGEACPYEISWLPGISSLVYFCNEVGISYEDVYTLSIHGREIPYIRQIAIHEKTFLLTDGDLPGIGRKLLSFGLGNVTVWAGTDLAALVQDIRKMTPEQLARFPEEGCRPLTVCLILNPEAEKWRNPYRRDEEFFRDGKTPMTKEEVRGIILGKLRPGKGDVIYDIGGGSGSVSVACAIAASDGTVYSVECDPEAAGLLDKNRRKFACDNIEIVEGRAPEALRGLPAPKRVFIGGSSGGLAAILAEMENLAGNSGKTDAQMGENYSDMRVVISSITLETNAAVSSYIHTSPYVKNSEVCQIAVTKSKKNGGSTLLVGQNPVTIFSFDLVPPCEKCQTEQV